MRVLLDCVSCGERAKPAASLLNDLEQLSSALDSGTTSSQPDFSCIIVNTKESTDESGIEEMLTNDLEQPGQVAAYPLYENVAEVINLVTDGRPEEKRIDPINGPVSLQVRETTPGVPTKSVFKVDAGEPDEVTDQVSVNADQGR